MATNLATSSSMTPMTPVPMMTPSSKADIFSQIEAMMHQTRPNDGSRELEECKARLAEVENQCSAAREMNYNLRRTMGDMERQNAQLRSDMQSLNDMYQQDVSRLKHEAAVATAAATGGRQHAGTVSDYDLRSSNDSLVSLDAANLKKKLESMKTSNTILKAEKEALIEAHKREKDKLVKQTAGLEEEAQQLRAAAEASAAKADAADRHLVAAEARWTQALDRATMCTEDRRASELRLQVAHLHGARENGALRRDVAALTAEVQHLQRASVDAETQFIAATAALKDVIVRHESELSTMQLKVVETKEVANTLKAQNQELDQEVSSLRMKHFSAVVEARTHIAERDQLLLDVGRLEAEKKQMEGVVAAVNRTAESQMDELMMHMRNMGAQNEALQAQLADAQGKHWDEVRRFKELEASLLAEVEALGKKASDNAQALAAAQTAREELETTSRQDAAALSLKVQELREQLDVATQEGAKLSADKSALEADRAELTLRLEKSEEASKAYLQTVKTAFENERAKLEDEVKKRAQKAKAIDAQRQELLKETHELGTQLAAAQGEATTLRAELAAAAEAARAGAADADALRATNATLSEDLKQEGARRGAAEEASAALRGQLDEAEGRLRHVTADGAQWQEERSAAQLRIAELGEVNEVLKAQLRETEQDVAALRGAYDAARGDLQRVAVERDQLAADLQRAEADRAGLESRLAREVSSLEGQRDDLQARLTTAHGQCDTTLAQLREMQNRHWEEVKALKDAEAALLSESDALTQEMHQTAAQLAAVRAEKQQLEQASKDEIGRLSHMAALMTEELEKRLHELSQVSAERAALAEAQAADKKRVAELEASLQGVEGSLKGALEAERARLQEEVRKKTAKVKALEGEKQELLQETHELSSQLSAAHRDLSTAQSQLAAAAEQLKEQHQHADTLKARTGELLDELKAAARREHEVRADLVRAEERARGEDARADAAIREAKKAAAQQVMDVSGQLRTAQDEVERLKGQLEDAHAVEKRAAADVERARKDVELVLASRDELQQQSSQEASGMRRELQEQRGKVKQLSEAKAVMEVDVATARAQLQKADDELARVRDRADAMSVKLAAAVSDAEAAKQGAREDVRVAKAKADELAAKAAYLEDALQKQRGEMERAAHDYSRGERDAYHETMRLKAQLEAFDQEVSELRPLIPLLRKENAESKARLEKLQASSTATVSGLLEELKVAEGTLSSERKKAQTEAESFRMQMMELQAAVERAKDNIEESVARAKVEKADKDKRIQQLENEVERLKTVSLSKDGRVDELERQHQDDRGKILALNLKVENAERAAADAVAAMEHEKSQVERLEKKLQAHAQMPGAGGYSNNNGGPGGLGRERAYSAHSAHSAHGGGGSARGSFGEDFRDGAGGPGGGLRSSFSMPPSEFAEYHSARYGVHSAGAPPSRYASTSSSNLAGRPPHPQVQGSASSAASMWDDEAGMGSSSVYIPEDDDTTTGSMSMHVPAHGHVPPGPQDRERERERERDWERDRAPMYGILSPARDRDGGGGHPHFQSPIDRVAAALAARAVKDRDAGASTSAPPAHAPSSSSSAVSRYGAGGAPSAEETYHHRHAAPAARPEMDDYDYDATAAGTAAVESSIQRTESFIKQRLRAAGAAGGAGGGGGAGADSSAPLNPSHGHSHAHRAHGPSVLTAVDLNRMRDPADDDGDEDDYERRSIEDAEGHGHGYGPPQVHFRGPPSSAAAGDDAVGFKRGNGSKPGSSRPTSSPSEGRENAPPDNGFSGGGTTTTTKRTVSAQSALPKIKQAAVVSRR